MAARRQMRTAGLNSRLRAVRLFARLLCLAAVPTLLRAAPATAAPAYTLDECLASGLEHSAALHNAVRDEALAETRIRQVRAEVLPHVSADGAYTRINEVSSMTVDEQEIAFGREGTYRVAGGVDQLLYAGGSVRAALNAAAAYRDIAGAQRAAATATLVRDIRQAFADLLLAEAAARVREQSVTQLQAWAEQVDQRFRQGAVSEFEANSARVRVANERPLLIRARTETDLARTRLRNLARLAEGPFEVRGELTYRPDTPAWPLLRQAALDQRPELRQAQRTVELALADLRATRGRTQPRVSARAGVFGDNPPAGTAASEWDWGWSAGLRAEWDIFDGGLRSAEVDARQIEVAKAEEQLGETRRQILLELETAHVELLRAAETVAATAESVTLAGQNLSIAEARAAAGLVTHIEYTDAQLALSTARLNRIEAVADHVRAAAAVDYACGRSSAPAGGD